MDIQKDKIYIVGHINPDLDSIASATGYSYYKHSLGEKQYIPIRCDNVNPLTEWIYEKYNTPLPEYISNISNMDVILVDHTYPEQRANGWERANILEVIDHHDVKLHDIIPMSITIRPCGSTSTLITHKYINSNINIPINIANILLSTILDDTLGLKSPTAIQIDIEMVNILKDICKVGDIWEFSKEIFSKKDIWNTLTPKEIVEMDIKVTEINGNTIAISQVETFNNRDIHIQPILNELENINISNPINLRLVMLTDVLEGNCILLCIGKDVPLLEKELETEIRENRVFLKDIVSRKKQILPILERMYR